MNEFENYLRGFGVKEITINKYSYQVKRFIEWYPNILNKTDKEIILIVADEFVKRKYQNDFKYAILMWLKYNDKLSVLKEIKEDRKRILITPLKDFEKKGKYVEYEEYQKLLNSSKIDQRHYILIKLLWYTGARITELLMLKKDCVYLEEGKYYISVPILKKTATEYRKIEIPEDLYNEFNKISNRIPIFTEINSGASHYISNKSKRIVGRKLYPHMFRATLETNMALKFGVAKTAEFFHYSRYDTVRPYLQKAKMKVEYNEMKDLYGDKN